MRKKAMTRIIPLATWEEYATQIVVRFYLSVLGAINVLLFIALVSFPEEY